MANKTLMASSYCTWKMKNDKSCIIAGPASYIVEKCLFYMVLYMVYSAY